MNEEIKELLSIISDGQDSIQRQQLVNYITNLQKENRINNDLIPCFKNREKELKKQITNLQKENDYYNKKNIELSELNTSLRSDRDNYKSRNEKAVEYIKNTTLYGFRSGKTLLSNYLDDLLNILEGGDE